MHKRFATLTFDSRFGTNRTRGSPMDDFRVGSTPPYDAHHDQQRPGNSNRKKARRSTSGTPEDEVHLGQSAESDPETEDNLGVQDYYTPSDRIEEAS
jgi:hypothetical protein